MALAAIVLSSHNAVIAKTVEGIVTSSNDGAAFVYGHPAEQMIVLLYDGGPFPERISW